MKIPRKYHNHEVQPSRGTRRRHDKQVKTKQKPLRKQSMHKYRKNHKRETVLERSVEKYWGCKSVLIAPNMTLNSDTYIQSAKRSSPSSVKHHSKTHIITNTLMKQIKVSNGDLKPVQEKKSKRKSRKCHNHKPQPFPDTKRKRKPTKPNKRKSNKRTKSTKISPLFPERGNRNAQRTVKHEQNNTRQNLK